MNKSEVLFGKFHGNYIADIFDTKLPPTERLRKKVKLNFIELGILLNRIQLWVEQKDTTMVLDEIDGLNKYVIETIKEAFK